MQKAKRFISLFITICLLMTIVPAQMAYADGSAYGGGTGTQENPYLITSAADFKQLAQDVNGGNSYEGKYFKIPDTVTETISLSTDDGYTPIGNDDHSFNGTFDGGNHTINLNLTGDRHMGLFGVCGSYSTICNIKTTGSVSGGRYYTGGVVAETYGKIVNCHNAASVSGATQVGGVVGLTENNIVNCSNSGTVGGDMNVGGIAGNVGKTQMVNCFNTGEITGDNCGGIVGIGGNNFKAYNCINNGAVIKNEPYTYLGGLIGGIPESNKNLINCYYNGTTNSEIGDFGHVDGSEEVYLARDFAKTGEEIVSDAVVDSLNVYADRNMLDNIKLFYWEIVDGNFAFTEDVPALPYQITNNFPNNITVDSFARAGSRVHYTVKNNGYSTFDVTVKDADGNSITSTPTDGGYYFIMPQSDVTISAENERLTLKEENGVYLIENADAMKALSVAVNSGYDTTGKSFELNADLSLSTDDGYTPIGNDAHSFNGTFDGGNHTINLNITGTRLMGLFGRCGEYSLLCNIKTTGSVSGTTYYTGGVVAYTFGKTVNCHNAASVSGATQVGGVVGLSEKHIVNCSNSGSVNGYMNVGGIAGNLGDLLQVVNCLNTGEITGENCGGIAGSIGGRTELYNCINNGTITKKNNCTFLGGLIGIKRESNNNFENCYYNGTINSSIGDFGHIDASDDVYLARDFAKTGEEIVSDAVIDSLNVYAHGNSPDNIKLFYWEIVDGNFAFSEEAPALPYQITNNSPNNITVDSFARSGSEVHYTVKDNGYSTFDVTVKDADGNVITSTPTEGGYYFIMPQSNVTISAEGQKLNLKEENGVYLIETADAMKALSAAVNSGYDTTDQRFELKADISLSTADGYEPIGTLEHGFNGTFDGGNHTVTLNLTGDRRIGLFGKSGSDSLICNVKTTGSVKADTYLAAGVVADALGDIVNCHNAASITGYFHAGGITGDSDSYGYIINCSNSGAIEANMNVGGIAGNATATRLVNCLNAGTVKGNYCGGIAGPIGSNTTMYNCINNGAVAKGYDDDYVGGLLGEKGERNNNIENCYYNGTINSEIGDFGRLESSSEPFAARNFAKTSEELTSGEVFISLNMYARANTPNDTQLL